MANMAASPSAAVPFTRLPNHVFNYTDPRPSLRLDAGLFPGREPERKGIQSTQDFVLRTDRSLARDRAASARSLQRSLQHQPYQPQPQYENQQYCQQRQEPPSRQRRQQQQQQQQQQQKLQQRQEQELYAQQHQQRPQRPQRPQRQQATTMAQPPPPAVDVLDMNIPQLPPTGRRPSGESYVSAASRSSVSNMSSPSSASARGSMDAHGRSASWSAASAAGAPTSSATTTPYQVRASMPRTSLPPRARPMATTPLQRPALIKPPRRTLAPPPAPAAPGELFALLPGEVLAVILDQLRQLHTARGSPSCATCWMRDACAVAVTARKTLPYARAALYGDIQLVGPDAAHQRKRLKPVPHSTRMVLLRRTLRSRPHIAALVRSFKPPRMPDGPGGSDGASGPDAEPYQNLVASVVMACPNLERVVGFYPRYDPASFSRFHHALATRQRLQAVTWIVDNNTTMSSASDAREETQAKSKSASSSSSSSSSRRLTHSRARSRSKSSSSLSSSSGNHRASFAQIMRSSSPDHPSSSHQQQQQQQQQQQLSSLSSWQPPHAAAFLELHSDWKHLTTVVIHACRPPGAAAAAGPGPDSTLLASALGRLPALQKLYLSQLPRASFDDASLLSLPPLQTLSLHRLPGLSADGLSAFATARRSRSLEVLVLRHVALDALQALARILSKLTRLASLTLVQTHPPTLTPGEVIWLFPYLASASLRRLHWDIPTYADRANAADMALARSIAAGGFPNLGWLRAPADPEGLFQALCRPLERADLPSDRFRHMGAAAAAAATTAATAATEDGLSRAERRRRRGRSSSSAGSSSWGHVRSSSSSNNNKSSSQKPPPGVTAAQEEDRAGRPPVPAPHSNLREARVAAQARLEAARDTPRFRVNVLDDSGLVETFGLAGFIGTVGSKIDYHLLPDPGASDEKGGLVGIEELLGDGGETIHEAANKGPEGCTGRWNANWDVPPKKDRERWWHTGRGRWHGAVLL